MNQLVKQSRSAAGAFAQRARRFSSKAAVVGTSMLASAAAFATPSGPGDAASTAITASKSQVDTVQTAVIGILVLLVIFSFVRRSMGK